MRFFERLYNGEIAPANEGTPDNEIFKEASHIENEAAETLVASFTDTQKELWKKIEDAQIEMEDQLHIQAFQQGFMIGVEMMQEMYADRLQKQK